MRFWFHCCSYSADDVCVNGNGMRSSLSSILRLEDSGWYYSTKNSIFAAFSHELNSLWGVFVLSSGCPIFNRVEFGVNVAVFCVFEELLETEIWKQAVCWIEPRITDEQCVLDLRILDFVSRGCLGIRLCCHCDAFELCMFMSQKLMKSLLNPDSASGFDSLAHKDEDFDAVATEYYDVELIFACISCFRCGRGRFISRPPNSLLYAWYL